MLDLFLIATVEFVGSFDHCVGMCNPLTVVAFSLSRLQKMPPTWQQQLYFQGLLNLVGAFGAVILAGGQLAGVGNNCFWTGNSEKPEMMLIKQSVKPSQKKYFSFIDLDQNLLYPVG